MLACDVTDDASVAKLVDQVLADAGRIDLLVNNAGMGLLGGAEESSMVQAQSLFDVNVFGVFRMTNAVLPTMRRQGKGRIVNLSSVQGFIRAPYFALYSSTQHAIEGYSDSLITNYAGSASALSWSSPPIPVHHSKTISRGRIVLDIYDSACAGMNVVGRKAMEKGDAPKWWPTPFWRQRPIPLRRGAMRREKWRARSVCCAVSSRIRIRQEPAKATRAAGPISTWTTSSFARREHRP